MDERERQYRAFNKRFPLESLANMKLDEYTNIKANTDDYFCYWIEHKLDRLGLIGKGFAEKFVIWRKGTPPSKKRTRRREA